MNTSILLILITVAILSLVDYIPRIFIRAKSGIEVKPGYGPIPRYVIMPSVYGNISYLQNISFLKKYRSQVVICTSKYETAEFYRDLRAACRKHGFRYICVDLPKVKGQPVKNAYTIYKGALADLNRLGVTKDTPCLLMDADTVAHKNVNNLIRTFIASQADIASLRCEADNPKKTIEILQEFEYEMAMDNRAMDSWLTSGACNLGKAGVLQHVFSRHSDFFAGGDIEIGKLAMVMHYKVRYIKFTFYTAVPDTVKAWFNQRIIWFAGGFRHHVANMASFGWYHFFMLFYNSLLLYLLFPLRWVELVNFPWTLLFLIFLSWIYVYILCIGKKWHKEYLLLPFYSFVQSMIILPIAIGRYFKYARNQRSFGLFNYDFTGRSMTAAVTNTGLNLASAGLILYVAFVFTQARLEYWAAHGYIARFLSSIF